MTSTHSRYRLAFLLAFTGVLGCSNTPPESPGTGAREAVAAFYEAIIREDWPAAYAAVHPDNRARCNLAEFTRRARQYRLNLGFPGEAVRVRASEENGNTAVAHLVIIGHSDGRERRYNEGVTMRRGDHGWYVVLPGSFGRSR